VKNIVNYVNSDLKNLSLKSLDPSFRWDDSREKIMMTPKKTTKRLGVIGGGQLAQMLAQAAEPLDIELHCWVDSLDCPAKNNAWLAMSDTDSPDDFKHWIESLDALTFEFENVDTAPLELFKLPMYPSVQALKIAQDRALEKNFFQDNGIATTEFKIVNSRSECKEAALKIGLPVIIKTCRDGYDGKGQVLIRSKADFEKLDQGFENKSLIIEGFVAFEREVSLISVRDQAGNIRYYPLTENSHEDGILRVSKAPYFDTELQSLAESYAQKVLTALDYVGVLAIEFFHVGTQLIANEMAPRVHNSGHWTIDGAQTSQFENHIRAVCGLPLGNTEALGYSSMVNFIGTIPSPEKVLCISNTHFYSYHKESKPNRKLGHATVCAKTAEERDALTNQLLSLLP
jgi:5-(carboxyamino)imidazole ribonucleotide synthase